MKVKTMIKLLETFDQDADVLIELLDGKTAVNPSGIVQYIAEEIHYDNPVYITTAIKDQDGNVV